MKRRNRNLKYFFIPLFLSFPVLWGINVMENRLQDFFYWHELSADSVLLASQERQVSFQNNLISMRPLRDKSVSDLELSAKSALSLFINSEGKERIIFEKEKNKKFPIASLTKLMTAKIVLDNYDLDKEIAISEKAVDQKENFGKLIPGKKFSVKYLLYPLLMESSNDAAFALADDYEEMSYDKFILLMNKESGDLGMLNTKFFNPSGLDAEDSFGEATNYSTVQDLAKLAVNLLKDPLVWEISATPRFNTYGPELVNTNELLDKIPRIVGGKTGYTEEALGCLLLVTKDKKERGFIISVILGANGTSDRFKEMEKLINWLDSAYTW